MATSAGHPCHTIDRRGITRACQARFRIFLHLLTEPNQGSVTIRSLVIGLRRVLQILLLVSLLLPACRRETALTPTPAAKQIILISIDTLRSDRIGAYGYAKAKTPNLDNFAQNAVLFERAYSHSPLTLPSHGTMFSGLLPSENGLRDNIGFTSPEQISMLAETLKQNGFETGAVVSAFVLRKATGIAQGFDFYDDAIRERAGVSIGGIQRSGSDSIAIATPWIKERKDKPFFFFLHLYEPHAPYDAPKAFRREAATPYDADVALADTMLGQFLEFLKKEDIFNEALIIIVSDHGEGLGEHGEAEHGIFLYRESLQVPLLIKPRGNVGAGRRVTEPVQLLDLHPTILKAAQLSAEKPTTGSDMLTLESKQRQIYSETWYPRLHFGWSELHSLIEGQNHFIEAPSPELYDLQNDPGERRNLKDSDRRTLTRLKEATIGMIEPISPPSSIDPEELRKLAALGYLGGSSSLDDDKDLPDPKTRTATFKRLQAAFALFRRGEDAEALTMFREILAENPKMVDLYEVTAKAHYRLGNREDAIEAARRGLQVAPQSSSLLIMLTNFLIDAGRLKEAEEHAELLLKKEPGRAHEMLARIELGRGNLGDAERQARAALVTDERALALVTLGRIEREKGDYASALFNFDAALRQNSASQKAPVVGLQYLRGDSLARLNRNSEAEEAFREEIALSPADPRAYQSLIVMLATNNRLEDATALVRRLIASSPTARSYASVARTLRVLGDERGAQYWTTEGLKKYPNDGELRALLNR